MSEGMRTQEDATEQAWSRVSINVALQTAGASLVNLCGMAGLFMPGRCFSTSLTPRKEGSCSWPCIPKGPTSYPTGMRAGTQWVCQSRVPASASRPWAKYTCHLFSYNS